MYLYTRMYASAFIRCEVVLAAFAEAACHATAEELAQMAQDATACVRAGYAPGSIGDDIHMGGCPNYGPFLGMTAGGSAWTMLNYRDKFLFVKRTVTPGRYAGAGTSL